MAIGAVLLDVGGVLVVPHEEPVGEALRAAHVHLGNVDSERAHFVAIASVDRGSVPDGKESPYIRGYADALAIARTEMGRATRALGALFAQPAVGIWRRVLPESVRGLRQLAERGLPLGIVSNADGTVEELLLRNQICQVGAGAGVQVVVIIDSAVVGVAKPDARIFGFGVDMVGLPPNEIAFVGDSLRSDVVGATAAGLMPVHFDPYDLCSTRRGHRHIRALAELQDSWH